MIVRRGRALLPHAAEHFGDRKDRRRGVRDEGREAVALSDRERRAVHDRHGVHPSPRRAVLSLRRVLAAKLGLQNNESKFDKELV